MSPRPKPKSVPSRLGPPPQLSQLHNMKQPPIMMQKKFEPKMREIMARQAKLVARWIHANLTWKKVLMSWMVMLVASKMVLLMLTYEYFTLTALISLQIFHGVWTIAFFCLNVIESRAILPNASCLLAGYLPATTVLHILLIPNDYPLEFIVTDAVGTFLAIITMFLLLRMECTEILHEAEEMWDRQGAAHTHPHHHHMMNNHSHSETSSESGASTSATSVRSGHSASAVSRHSVASTAIQSGAADHFNQQLHHYHQCNGVSGRRIMGNPSGPTVITVNGIYDSILFNSVDEPGQGMQYHNATAPVSGNQLLTSANPTGVHDGAGMVLPRHGNNVVLFDDAVDLEPIDFEHFVDEIEDDSQESPAERMFKVTFDQVSRGR